MIHSVPTNPLKMMRASKAGPCLFCVSRTYCGHWWVLTTCLLLKVANAKFVHDVDCQRRVVSLAVAIM